VNVSFGDSQGIAADANQNILLAGIVSDAPAHVQGRLIRVDPGGNQQLLASSSLFAFDRVALEASGQILATNGFLNTPGVARIDPVTGAVSVLSSGGILPYGLEDIEVESGGSIVVVGTIGYGPARRQPELVRINPATGAQTPVPGSTILDFAIAGIAWVSGMTSDGAGGFFSSGGRTHPATKTVPAPSTTSRPPDSSRR